ncbi:MAG: hypothetical protein AAGD14_16565 [Planctomycetota bacterium]
MLRVLVPVLVILVGVLVALVVGDGGSSSDTSIPPKAPRKKAPPPVPAGMLAVEDVNLVPSYVPDPEELDGERRWMLEWLGTSGWAFWGWKLEAGSRGEAEFMWHDPREMGREFVTLRLDLEPRTVVRVVLGVRLSRFRTDVFDVICPSCETEVDRRRAFPGSATVACTKCRKAIPIDAEWARAKSRDFRLLVLGADRASTSEWVHQSHLDGVLGVPSKSFGFAGRIERRFAFDPRVGNFDPDAHIRGGHTLHRAGRSLLSTMCVYASGGDSSMRTQRSGDRVEFRAQYGDTVFEGTRENWTVAIGGEQIELSDYPHPVWRFELDWKPAE